MLLDRAHISHTTAPPLSILTQVICMFMSTALTKDNWGFLPSFKETEWLEDPSKQR